MNVPNQHEQWHLSKSVPISLVLFLVLQTIGLVVWAVKLDSRVATLESIEQRHDQRLIVLEQMRDRIIIIEERQNVVIRGLEGNGKKIDLLLEDKTRK